MKEMAQVLNTLKKELNDQGDTVAKYEQSDYEEEGEWIAQGWCEALAFAIKKIEEAMEQSQRAEAVNSMTNYLLTGDRGTHGTEESN